MLEGEGGENKENGGVLIPLFMLEGEDKENGSVSIPLLVLSYIGPICGCMCRRDTSKSLCSWCMVMSQSGGVSYTHFW